MQSPRERRAAAPPPPGVQRHPFAWTSVLLIAAAAASALVATVNSYGYERDELYFRMLSAHPAWGYVDEPPLTPMLVRVGIGLFGDNLWGVRLPAIVCAFASVLLTALICRELGGSTAAQALSALGVSSTFVLIAGHVLLTASADMVFWLLTILFIARALLGDQSHRWLAVGVVVGLSLYNKQLIALLVLGVLAGLLIAGPRRILREPRLWVGAALALAIGLPTLLYQASNGWPEATMASVIASKKGPDDRLFLVPFQLLLLGITVVPIWVAGLIHVLREGQWAPVRALGWAYPVVLVLVFVTGGQAYYTFGLVAFLYAAGCVVVARWAAGRLRRWTIALAAVVATVAMAVPVALPLIGVASLPAVITTVNQTVRDSIGWPTYVQEIAAVGQRVPPTDRSLTIVLTENYGEAGAVDRYGPAMGLPQVYSGQNELFNFGPPPAVSTTVITVGFEPTDLFGSCTPEAVLDNRAGIDNEEQGRPVFLCYTPRTSWEALWPQLRHYG